MQTVTEKPDRATPAPKGGPRAAPRSERRSFFEIYKRGQGYFTRVGTAVGAGVLILAGADFLYRQLGVFESDAAWTLWVQVGVPVAVTVLFGLLLYWITGVKRSSCDFMIATEGEMKKVSWSTKRELIGSTKVVIVFSLLIAALLFVVDICFMTLFGAINVLKVAPSLREMLTGN
jgi:preprotein translocase subunit SecE